MDTFPHGGIPMSTFDFESGPTTTTAKAQPVKSRTQESKAKQEPNRVKLPSDLGLIVVGYMCALSSYIVLQIAFGLAGAIIGTVLITRRSGHGIVILIGALVLASLGISLRMELAMEAFRR